MMTSRPPCCEKVEIKKGPWTPEEDIILVSYIQEHGPGNWRSVSASTGLMRDSQSCRHRWTNYLRPGIRRGNFSRHEKDIIVHLHSLLGNKWATIASYLPRRTDNDIKNYWSNNFKKKLNKPSPAPSEPFITRAASHVGCHHDIAIINPLSKDCYARPDSQCSPVAATTNGYSSSSSYAFSMNNMSKLLNSFIKSTPTTQGNATDMKHSSVIDNDVLLPFDHVSGGTVPSVSGSTVPSMSDVPPPPSLQQQLSSIEDWWFDEVTELIVDQLMEISEGCCSVPMLL